MARLGDIVRIRTGKLDANASSESGEYPFFTCAVEPLKIDYYDYDCECVLVAGNGDLNVKYYSGKFNAYQRTYIIESLDKEKLCVPYLYYFMEQYIETLRKESIGGVIKYIKLGNLTEADVQAPNCETQHVIVATLKQVDYMIALRKQQLAKLDELVKARFVEMFGDPVANPMAWSIKPLHELGSCKNGMNFRYDDTGIELHCLGVGDFQDRSVIDDVVALPMVSLNEMPSEEYLLQDNDIVFVRSNGNKALVGRSVVVYPGNIPTTFSGFCIRFRNSDRSVLIPYLIQVLKSDSVRKKMAGRGANIQNLNQQILGSLIIPVPPLEMQTHFSDYIKAVNKTKETVQQGLDKLETLKSALMQEYFG